MGDALNLHKDACSNTTFKEQAFQHGDVILGRYRVVHELGRGGMGIVYLCKDLIAKVLVAVKGLPPEVSHSSDEMDDILRNYQLVRELRHGNIAAVTNLERDKATGDYFLVMDYAEGSSLKKWMFEHSGLACWRKKVAILRQVADALDYAHGARPRHIIHRDVKPVNIIVDDMNDVKVLDFGLAAQIRSSLSRVSLEVTSRSGTPVYKSPEQWLAQPQREASDQYSLGVIAYQMLADVLPFDDDNSTVLREAVVNDPVPAAPELSRHVNRVLAKALAKRAEDRYESCRAFVSALEDALEHGDEEPAGEAPTAQPKPEVTQSQPSPSPSPALSSEAPAPPRFSTTAFALPESEMSSEPSERAELDVFLPDVPTAALLQSPLEEREIGELECFCKSYRTLLAESAMLHQKRGDDRTAAVLRRLQKMVRDAAPQGGGQGNPDELIRIFTFVGLEFRSFRKRRLEYPYFMEHRRGALLLQRNRAGENAVTKALFSSIE